MNHARNAALLLDLHGDNETLAANGDEFILNRATLGESTQVALLGLLDVPALLLGLAANARQFG